MAAKKKSGPQAGGTLPSKKKTSGKKLSASQGQEAEKICPVVGIGASAGGLEALEGFFSHMAATSDMAFVVIQHMSSSHKSIMGSLLERHTTMPIDVIEDGMVVSPNHIYLNPPDKNVAIHAGTLHLFDPIYTGRINLPIDAFFRSLAEDRGNKAICIILSGSATDGTLGLREIKGQGGMAMVQQETQAKYDGMPKSAIDTGLVDFILPVEQMGAELVKYIRHPYVNGSAQTSAAGPKDGNYLEKIFLQIRSVTGHDFSNYKPTTTRRRIQRRMALHQLGDMADYFHYLRQTPTEINILFQDMLIGVTSFFRDPKAFDVLSEEVLPALMSRKEPGSTVRVWVPACATGEEAYSLAMLFFEEMEKLSLHLNIQIFASDLDATAIDFARSAIYPENIAADVSEERLSRFFIQEDGRYRINKQVREMVVFAVQDIIKDPPFSNLDMLSCRNLLIYMDTVLQKKLLPMFHRCLGEGGILFLSPSENIGGFTDIFEPVSLKWKIFKSKDILPERRLEFPVTPLHSVVHEAIAGEGSTDSRPGKRPVDVRQLAEKIVFENYAPVSVLIDEKFQVLYLMGDTRKYLELPTGEPTYNILDMAREGLKYKLRTAIHKAMRQRESVLEPDLLVQYNDAWLTFDLRVNPLMEAGIPQGLMMVVFDEKTPPPAKPGRRKKASAEDPGGDPQTVSLQQELHSTKEYLQATIEALETSNEELKSTNEEMQSVNEELQSTNEELETSKEELQSINEELITVNAELHEKIHLLNQFASDIANLLASTDVATVFLDIDLNIRRFTPPATRLFNLINTDIGRPLSHMTSNILYEGLYEDASNVIATLNRKQVEIRTKNGEWYDLRMAPYRTVDNVVDGLVITLIDITQIREAQIVVNRAHRYADYITASRHESLLLLDRTLRVVFASRPFYDAFRVPVDKTKGILLYELGNGQWDIPDLRKLLEEILPEQTVIEGYEVEHDFEIIGKRKMRLNARRLGEGDEELILLEIEDITGSKQG